MSEQKPYETALIEYGTFMVAGYTAPVTETSDLGTWWETLYQRLDEPRKAVTEKLQKVGVVMPDADDTGYTYTAGFIVPGGIKDVAALGLTGVVVPGSMYATALVEGPILPGHPPEHVKAGFEYLSTHFIPAKGLEATGVCLEVYGPGDVTAENYRLYVWQAVTGQPA
ncbi:GyrI-like domain-containing protein [Rothia nasimurium]|uniref:GyrI-like domain-containing protein n=1 Tax=Rothia nasimurium TaxID=85336 RepID=UPI003B9EC136